MNQPNDDFLRSLYEEPRPEFVEALWQELADPKLSFPRWREDGISVCLNGTLPHVEAGIPKMIGRANGQRFVITPQSLVKKHDRTSRFQRSSQRISLVATLLLLIAVLILVGVTASNGRLSVANLRQEITPTVNVEHTATHVSGQDLMLDEAARLALESAELALPHTVFDLEVSQLPTTISLRSDVPTVRLRFEGEANTTVLITLELAASVPREDAVIRLSRQNGSEVQPLLIYKPEQLTTLPMEFPIAQVDEEGKSDLIVQLLTPLSQTEELSLRIHLGTPQTQASCMNCVPITIQRQHYEIVGGQLSIGGRVRITVGEVLHERATTEGLVATQSSNLMVLEAKVLDIDPNRGSLILMVSPENALILQATMDSQSLIRIEPD